MWPLWLVEMSLQHIQKNSPRLLPKPAKFEKNPPNGYRVIRKTKCGAGGAGGAGGAAGAGGAGGARSSPIHKQASLAGRLISLYVFRMYGFGLECTRTLICGTRIWIRLHVMAAWLEGQLHSDCWSFIQLGTADLWPLHYCIDKVEGFIHIIWCTVQHAAFISGWVLYSYFITITFHFNSTCIDYDSNNDTSFHICSILQCL